MSDTKEADFGSYLASVYERDIDLLLMEEFHVSANFVSWFSEVCGVPDAIFDGAWHSVTDADGETDLLLRVRADNRRVGIMIENKVAAPEQDRQDERYHLRAARNQQAAKFDTFITCMCAPQVYLGGLSKDNLYQRHVSYEQIADWYAERDGPRHAWRCRIIHEAILQGRRGYKMIVNETVSGFHLAFWEMVQQQHPSLIMRRPTPKGNKSDWMIMKGHDFPAGVQLHYKMDQRAVELGFRQRTVSEIKSKKGDWPSDIVPVQKNGTTALKIAVPYVDRLSPLETQLESLKAVFTALERLLPYGRLLD